MINAKFYHLDKEDETRMNWLETSSSIRHRIEAAFGFSFKKIALLEVSYRAWHDCANDRVCQDAETVDFRVCGIEYRATSSTWHEFDKLEMLECWN